MRCLVIDGTVLSSVERIVYAGADRRGCEKLKQGQR